MEVKSVICNGGLNPSLTREELLNLEGKDLIQAAWYLVCAIGSGNFYPEIASTIPELYRKAYEKVTVTQYTHSDLHTNTKEKLEYLLDTKEQLKTYYLSELCSKEFSQGSQLYKLQNELNFKGRFELTPNQINGYISVRKDWNGFEVSAVKRAIAKLEKIMPVTDYGVNNPNTGARWHQWSISDDYIFLNSPYLSKQTEIDKWSEFFKSFKSTFMVAGADSVQSNAQKYGEQIKGFEFYAWWD